MTNTQESLQAHALWGQDLLQGVPTLGDGEVPQKARSFPGLAHQAANDKPSGLSHGKLPIPENSNLVIHRKEK